MIDYLKPLLSQIFFHFLWEFEIMGFKCNQNENLCLPELSGMFVEASYFRRSSADDLEMNVQ